MMEQDNRKVVIELQNVKREFHVEIGRAHV